MRRNIQQEISRTTASARRDDVVAARHTITRTDLVDGPITIAQKGIYSLAASFSDVRFSTSFQEVILIASNNVELNLSGFEISLAADYAGKVPPDFALIRLAAGVSQVFIKSGVLKNAPIGVSALNNRKIRISDLALEGITRKGLELHGLHGAGSEIARVRVCTGPRPRSERYEHAYQLLRYLLEGSFHDSIPVTLVPDLQEILAAEDSPSAARSFKNDDEETPADLSGTTETGAVGLELIGSPQNVAVQSVLVDNVSCTVIAEPREVVAVLYDDGMVLRDDAGYPIRYSALQGNFEDSRDSTLLLAQIWIASQTGSLPEEILWAVSGSESDRAAVLEKCVSVFGGDFRGSPMEAPAAIRFHRGANCHLKRMELACANLLKDDGRDGERIQSSGARPVFRDAVGISLSDVSSSTLEHVSIYQTRSLAGWSVGFLFESDCPLNILQSCRLGAILSIPTRENDWLSAEVRAVGVRLPPQPRDLKIEDLRLEEDTGEISCGVARGVSALLYLEPPAPGRTFTATFGQTVLGMSEGSLFAVSRP